MAAKIKGIYLWDHSGEKANQKKPCVSLFSIAPPPSLVSYMNGDSHALKWMERHITMESHLKSDSDETRPPRKPEPDSKMKPAALGESQESGELCIVSIRTHPPPIDHDFPQRLADTSPSCAILSTHTCLMRSSRPVKWKWRSSLRKKKNHSQIPRRTYWWILSRGKKLKRKKQSKTRRKKTSFAFLFVCINMHFIHLLTCMS